ncbi:hypothetical protein A9Q84_13570 [Halobacteriovorax marinus]|uniref:Response regulatory domain-containing protein n=1 Tax=Halobacteriovorax marinus TaxID=97084 RepID=A0A1Y5F8X8_9BACT|nr:hypothetical protein A9Q84_13570 [Halobacteriovorax marinus]
MVTEKQNIEKENKREALEYIEQTELCIHYILSKESQLSREYGTILTSIQSLKNSLIKFGLSSESDLVQMIEDIVKIYENKKEFSESDLNAILSSLAIVAYRLEGNDHSISPRLFEDIKHLLGDHSCDLSQSLKRLDTKHVMDDHFLKVLVIDDDPDYQVLLKAKLSNFCNIDFCSSADEGIGLIKENPKNYQVIFCDYKMPDENGLYLVDVLRTLDFDIPIVVFSANATTTDLKEILEREVYSYIDKLDGINPFKLVINKIQRKAA